jgi:S1-C subfamily serine protease
MKNIKFTLLAVFGYLLLLVFAAVVLFGFAFVPAVGGETQVNTANQPSQQEVVVKPTFTVQPENSQVGISALEEDLPSLQSLYKDVAPGVVNISVLIERQGQTGAGAGSGFVLDDHGHIVTNNHVVADAELISVVYEDGFESEAEVVGVDSDSDLAVIKVDSPYENARPLPLGNSDQIKTGDWVVAIGNPFGNQSSMTLGIVSAVGRSIPTGVTPFNIPHAIQTDAAINPGNSGGPLLNLEGEVIGVNAQIATGGAGASAGVGFALPSNLVRKVVPVLIDEGEYIWPWLGASGNDVNLLLARANNLNTQRGAYLASVTEGGPAAKAGLQGSSGETKIDGVTVPLGGDVVTEIDGAQVLTFSDLAAEVADHHPGDTVNLKVLRDGKQMEFKVALEPRPEQ